MAVTGVVVHYRGGQVFERCVAACRAAELALVVVDNGGLPEGWARPGTRVLRLGRNRGYGAAANAGLGAAGEGPVLVLNQDVELSREALERLVTAGVDAGAWIAAPRLQHAGGRAAAKSRFPAPLSWPAPDPTVDGVRPVPWVSGAAMLFLPGHTDLRFDERFHMYAEDEEICYRVWWAGGSVVLVEDAKVWHAGGTATAQRWSRPAITARTLVNRARMVGWHAGWLGLPRYLRSVVGGSVESRDAWRRGGA